MIKKYPPPKSSPEYVKMWAQFIDDLTTRPNFHEGHLRYLEILCDLYQEYSNLTEIIELEGTTYETEGRHGAQIKPRPEVTQRSKIIDQISTITRNMSLVPKRSELGGVKTNEEEAWD